MRQATKVFTALAACALVWAGAASPVLANCLFSVPIVQTGTLGGPIGSLNGVAPFSGDFYMLGQNDVLDTQGAGSGVDCGTLCGGAGWIVGNTIAWDWGNAGSDGCPGNTAAGTFVVALQDAAGDVGIGAVSGQVVPVPHYDLGKVGALQFRPPVVIPHLVNVAIVDSLSITANVEHVGAGLDQNDLGGGTYFGNGNGGIVDPTGFSGPCPDGTGCTGATIAREQNVCWTGGGGLVDTAVTQGVCAANLAPCVNDPSDACIMFASTCNESTVYNSFGPSFSGGCVFIGGPVIDDTALLRRSEKNRQFRVFSFDVTQFAVSHMVLRSTDRNTFERQIARIGANDGSTVTYTVNVLQGELRGAKKFELEVVRTDGQSFTVSEE